MQHCIRLHFGQYIARPENVDFRCIMYSRPCLIFEVLIPWTLRMHFLIFSSNMLSVVRYLVLY